MHILKKAWEGWKTIAHHIGVFQSRVILTVFYYTILLPFGIIFSLFKDEMGIKAKKSAGWKIKNKHMDSLERMREQY